MKPRVLSLVVAAQCSLLAQSALAQGTAFTYQGQLTENGNPVNGFYDLRFALFDTATVGTGVQQVSPLTNSATPVSNGLFTVTLDFGAGVFPGADRWLEIASRTNGAGAFGTLAPRQQITSTPYAVTAAKVTGTVPTSQLSGTVGTAQLADTSVTSVKILDGTIGNADLAVNAVTSSKILDGTILGVDLANNTVGSDQLADFIELGRSNVFGQLDVFYANTALNQPAISLQGSSSRISTYGSDGQEQTRLWGTSWGEIYLFDNSPANGLAVTLSANNTSGGFLELNRGSTNREGLRLYGGTTSGGEAKLFTAGNQTGVDLRAQYDSTYTGAFMALYHTNQERITFAAQNASTGRGGLIDIKNNSELSTIQLIGDTGSGDSRLDMYAGGTNLSFRISADDSASGSSVYLYNGTGQARVEIDSDDGDNGAVIRLYDAGGGLGILLDAESSSAGYIAVYGTNGTQKIILDGQSPDGNGRISTDELRITGNVGIGITNPTNKLHVIGGATFASGTAGANQVVVWTPGSGSWSFTSDRNAKDRFAPVDGREVLEKLAHVPVAEWSYIGYDQRHIGPMAQDFHAQFPLNGDDKSLNDADLHGVALAAIQGLNQKLEAELNQRAQENQQLKLELNELKQLVKTLNQRVSTGAK